MWLAERRSASNARIRHTPERARRLRAFVLTDVAVFSPRENLPLRLGVGRLLLFPPTPTISAAETAATPSMRTKAQQMLRKASVFLGKASREVRIPSLSPPARFPATVPSRGALAMDTSHRGGVC